MRAVEAVIAKTGHFILGERDKLDYAAARNYPEEDCHIAHGRAKESHNHFDVRSVPLVQG